MKIAIIGSGISGLTCAHYLHQAHDISLYEANDYIGGHTATVDVTVASGTYAIDTGFIVFNDKTYPHFRSLLASIGIAEQPTEMSFSVSNLENGLEYNGHNLSTLFAQKRNLINPRFYYFLYEIVRFNYLALREYEKIIYVSIHTETKDLDAVMTLGAFLQHHGFSEYFCQNYILPMGAAVWSSTFADMRRFPLRFFISFFYQHGLLNITQRPQWYVIPNGSRSYVGHLIAPFQDKIHLNSPVTKIYRCRDYVEIEVKGKRLQFDQVIFATHSDQVLSLIDDPTLHEVNILSQMQYQQNDVVLHTDTHLLPQQRKAWASWNYHLGDDDGREQRLANLTYNMNILQGISAPETFCVSLNSTNQIEPNKILKRFTYAHPVFNQQMIDAQKQRELISGVGRTWFCGAYWYNGFHEDGVRSALDVVQGISFLES